MEPKDKNMKRDFNLFKKRIEYFFEKKNQVFICTIHYHKAPFVSFGVAYLDAPYEEEKELRRGIYARKLKDGKVIYVTHARGEFCTMGYNLLREEEGMIVAYNPKQWDFASRDRMLAELFIRASIGIKAAKEVMEEEYEKGKVSLAQMNERIRKSNLAQFEIDQLMERYCYSNI